MATEQILLSSSAFEGMRETGGFGQPLHTLYPQIRAVLTEQLGADAADLLAEPVVTVGAATFALTAPDAAQG